MMTLTGDIGDLHKEIRDVLKLVKKGETRTHAL